MIVIQFKDDKALVKKLSELPTKLQNKVLKSATHNALRPVLSKARQYVANASGLLKKSLGIKSKLYRRSGTAVAMTGARSGFRTLRSVEVAGRELKRWSNPVHYSHIVEGGTQAHEQPNLNTIHPGAMPRPFLDPASKVGRPAMEARFGKEIAKGLERIARAK